MVGIVRMRVVRMSSSSIGITAERVIEGFISSMPRFRFDFMSLRSRDDEEIIFVVFALAMIGLAVCFSFSVQRACLSA